MLLVGNWLSRTVTNCMNITYHRQSCRLAYSPDLAGISDSRLLILLIINLACHHVITQCTNIFVFLHQRKPGREKGLQYYVVIRPMVPGQNFSLDLPRYLSRLLPLVQLNHGFRKDKTEKKKKKP